jgi:hypothetical protein
MVVTVVQAGGLLAVRARLRARVRGRAGQREDRHDHGKQHTSGSSRAARQDSMHDS